MLDKLRSLLDNENSYFFAVKNYIVVAIVLFSLINSALLGLNRGLSKKISKQVVGVLSDQDLEIVIEEGDIEGIVIDEHQPGDQTTPADDAMGKILQEAAFISREEMEESDISTFSDDASDAVNGNGSSSEKDAPVNGTSSAQTKKYTVEEQTVISAAAATLTAIKNKDGQSFYRMLTSELQKIFDEQDVLEAFATQVVNISSTQILSDPEIISAGYAQIKVKFNFADQTSKDYWIYLLKEDGVWRLLGTELSE